MIFNPLFLSENNGSQIMAPKQTKMSNSKYLFSDIVKVVMNPLGESTEMTKTNNGMMGNNIGLSLEDNQKPVQLKLKFLSDLDNEEAKLGLAEILPIEIAQLLVKDETENSEDKAVSYISKEPLTGELQNFVNNLIGPELIESHLNNKSGLLLSLEDSKSAVNLELVQLSGNKSVNDNIVVQTLVVPEKSKLLSLMGNVQAKNGLFRIDSSQIQNLTNISNPTQNLSESTGDTKPTLSVYSFNYGGDQFESLTKSIKLNGVLKPGLTVVSKSQDSPELSEGIRKVPLEKISFIPSELKNSQQLNSASSLISDSLKLVKKQGENNQKDFSVSKITIVKKTADLISPEKITTNKLFESRLDTELKRIDFGNQIALNAKSGKNKNDVGLPNKANNQDNGIFKNKIANTQKDENVNQNKIIQDAVKNVNSKLEVSSNNQIENKQQSIDGNKNILVNSKIVSEKNEATNVNNKTVTDNKSTSKPEIIKTVTPQESLKDIQKDNSTSKMNNLTESTKVDSKLNLVDNDKEVKSKHIPNSDTKISLSDSDSPKSNEKLGSEIKTADKLNQTSDKDIIENSKNGIKNNPNSLNEVLLKTKEPSLKEASEKIPPSDEKGIITQNTELKNDEPLANKKISVKVKGEVKSISEKLDTQTKSNQDTSQKENSSSSSNTDKENSSSGAFKNTPFANPHFNLNVSTENSFEHIMNGNGVGVSSEIQSKNGIQSESKHKVVTSIEVLKEVTKFISKQEKGSLSFDIKPEQLGKMKITLDTADHVIRAKIEVDSEQAKQLIERNLDKLHQELTENGIELNSLNISLSYSKEQKEERETMNNSNNNQTENLGQVGESEEEQKKSLGYNTYEYIA
ncbi:MAG: flagellar hook-length control protein FliK [Melioribacteraceae bacterium]|nr:flagellar hook-length control protein FliK [Melioribacteraceae bacterium]